MIAYCQYKEAKEFESRMFKVFKGRLSWWYLKWKQMNKRARSLLSPLRGLRVVFHFMTNPDSLGSDGSRAIASEETYELLGLSNDTVFEAYSLRKLEITEPNSNIDDSHSHAQNPTPGLHQTFQSGAGQLHS